MGSTSMTATTGGGRLAALVGWIDDRFPMTKLWKEQVAEYYAPKNMDFWYFFGSLAMMVLVIQILTGIFLTMNYKPRRPRPSARSNTSCATWSGAG
jgi:ubiquinol-cytochrome c reductase cytochrome b subunit